MQNNQRPSTTKMVYRSYYKDLMQNYETELVCVRNRKKKIEMKYKKYRDPIL